MLKTRVEWQEHFIQSIDKEITEQKRVLAAHARDAYWAKDWRATALGGLTNLANLYRKRIDLIAEPV